MGSNAWQQKIIIFSHTMSNPPLALQDAIPTIRLNGAAARYFYGDIFGNAPITLYIRVFVCRPLTSLLVSDLRTACKPGLAQPYCGSIARGVPGRFRITPNAIAAMRKTQIQIGRMLRASL